MSIFSNSNISIEKTKNSYKLIFKNKSLFPQYHEYLSNSFPNTSNKKQNEDTQELLFNCSNIQILNNKNKHELSYNDFEVFFIWFKGMLENLEKDNNSLLLLNMNDFVLITLDTNRNVLLFINSDKFLPLSDNKIELLTPFSKKNIFLSPELYKLENIPSKINKKSIFYSISVFITHCLNNIDNIEDLDFNKQLESINNTKLFFAMIRCLKINPNNRYYLFI